MRRQKFFTVVLCVELLTFSVAADVRAQTRITFPPTQRRGAPARTVGGGQRGTVGGWQRGDGLSCLTSNKCLTALTPDNNVVTTLSAHPTLFWYVPQTEAKFAEFAVIDKSNFNEVYKTTVAVKGTPGIVKLSIPRDVSLEIGKEYWWKFSLIYNSENGTEEEHLAGLIERTELNWEEKMKLAAATEPLKKAEVYAKAKIWQETLSLVAQLRDEHPNDSRVRNAWLGLLTSVNLEEIATKPLVECCTVDHAQQEATPRMFGESPPD